MAVDEDGVFWEGVVVINYVGKIHHCFVALVGWEAGIWQRREIVVIIAVESPYPRYVS